MCTHFDRTCKIPSIAPEQSRVSLEGRAHPHPSAGFATVMYAVENIRSHMMNHATPA
jgi:hypothetical protein